MLDDRSAFALMFSTLVACAPEPPPPNVVPPAHTGLMLGAADVPQGTFGDAEAPDFEEGFARLAADGFDTFLPVFLTNESGESTAEPSFFLPPDALPGVDADVTCTSDHNPWAAAGDIGIVLPAYMLVFEQAYSATLDTEIYKERLAKFVERCLDGDPARVRGLYLYDEPASNSVGTRLDVDPFNDFRVENLGEMAAASREVLDAETFVVEAPLPWVLPLLLVPEVMRPQLEEQFHVAVAKTAPYASVYGFDLYPVDAVTNISPIADYVDLALDVAPQAMPIAVLQAFGMDDMEIEPVGGGTGRQPTLEETRAMAFIALVHGARGIFWYGQSALTVDEPGTWNDVRRVVGEIRSVEELLLAPAGDLDVENARLHATALNHSDGRVALVVNPTNASQPVTLPAGTDLLSGDALEEDAPIPAYGVRMLRIP